MHNRDYEKLLSRGNNILVKVMPELNRISDERIRKKDNNIFRRQEDCEEIAIALALYDEFIDGLLV